MNLKYGVPSTMVPLQAPKPPSRVTPQPPPPAVIQTSTATYIYRHRALRQRSLIFSMDYNLVLLGEQNVGKSSLMQQLCTSHLLLSHDPTVEDSLSKRLRIGKKVCTLKILDTGGGNVYSTLKHQWIEWGHGFLVVYSITDLQSFWKAIAILDDIERIKGGRQLPVLLVGNKCDIKDSRQVSTQYGSAMAEAMRCSFTETSAKTGCNVENAFLKVATMVRRIRREEPLQLRLLSTQHSLYDQDQQENDFITSENRHPSPCCVA